MPAKCFIFFIISWTPCFFKIHAEYIMQNAILDDSQAEIKIAGENINAKPVRKLA